MTEEVKPSGDPGKEAAPRPFVAPCRDLPVSAPWRWLSAGWQDYRATLSLSLSWGLFCFFLSAGVTYGAWLIGRWGLLISVLSGFVFVGPLLAFGLYSVSRRRRQGVEPTLRSTLRAAKRPFANAIFFAMILLGIFLLWARAGMMVHIFFPTDGEVRFEDLLMYLGVGSAVGSVFALVCFMASVFSLPFVANRETDVITAVVSSINAVLRNRVTMALWALIIVILTAIGFVSGMLAFIVIIPWLAYATWHAYRDALDVDEWPILPR